MPAYDECHPQIVRALEKDGWRITKEHARYSFSGRFILIDLKAIRGVNGTSQQILLSEVKCFPDANSNTRELYTAIGQYIIYQAMLNEVGDDTPLYLTIPETIYSTIFDKVVQRAIADHQVNLILVNLDQEEITQWIKW